MSSLKLGQLRPWILGLLVVLAPSVLAEELYVTVRKAPLRAKPVVWSKATSTLKYGDRVDGKDDDQGWYYVSKGGRQGYLHESALSDDPVEVVNASVRPRSSRSNDSVSLATKGFDQTIENEYRKSNPRLRFDRVAAMERRKVSNNALVQFMKQGKLID